jgi:hypothetical protein
MSFLDRLKQAAAFAARTSPIGTVASLVKKAAPVVEDKLSNVRSNAAAAQALQNAQRATTAMPGGLKRRIAEEVLIKPAARAAAAVGLETTNRLSGQKREIADTPLSRQVLSGPLSSGYAGEQGGQVVDVSEQLKRIGRGEGDAGKLAKAVESKTGIKSKYTAPLIGIGALALDINPVPDAKDATKTGVKLLDAGTGLLKNIPYGEGKVLNHVDLLGVLKKAGKKVDDASTIVRRTDGKVRLLPQTQVASWLQKNPGSEVVSDVGAVAKAFGYKNAKEYAADGTKLSFTQTDKNMRARAGLPQAVADTKQTKPVEQMDIGNFVDGYASKIDDPYKAKDAINFDGDPMDALGQTLAVVKKLTDDGSEEAMLAKNALLQQFETSGNARKVGQLQRLMREFYKENPKSFMFEVDSELLNLNRTRQARGLPRIELPEETRKAIQDLVDRAAKEPKGSLTADALFAQASKLVGQRLPIGVARGLSSWFKSSILSSPATAVINIAGTLAPMPVEGVARGLQRTLGNAFTKATLGVKGSAGSSAKNALSSATEAAKTLATDTVRGTNSFGDYTEGIGQGAKTFFTPDKIRSPRDLAVAVGDGMERISKITTGLSDIPARAAYKTQRIEEITKLAQEAGEDISNPRIQQLINERADFETDFRFFTNSGALSDLFAGLNRGIRRAAKNRESAAARGTMEFFADAMLPFVKVPPNLISRGVVDYSAVGFFKSLYKFGKALKNRKGLSQFDKVVAAREFQQGATRGLVGSALAVGVALGGHELGVMTFGRSDKDKLADVQSAQRIPPYGLNVEGLKRATLTFFEEMGSGKTREEAWEAAKSAGVMQDGDSWIGYDAVQPLAIPVAAVGKWLESGESNESLDWVDKFGKSADAVAKSILGRPIFTNFKTLGSAAQTPTDSVASWVGNVVAGLVTPGALSFVAQATDQKDGKGIVRETFSGSIGESIANRIRSRVPGLRNDLPQAVDLGGNPLTTDSPIGSALGRDLAPQSVSTPPALAIGQKLYEETGETVAIPTRIDKRGSRYNVDFNLSSDDLVKARTIYGKATEAKLKQLAQDPEFLGLTRKQQADKLSREYADIKGRIDAFYVAKELGVTTDSVSWYKWKDVFDNLNERKDALGRNVFFNLSSADKATVVKRLLEQQQ